MNLLLFAFGAVFVAVPKEFHVDCSGWPGAAVVDIHFCFTPMKGKRINTRIEMQPDTSPTDVRDAIERSFRNAGWHYRKVGKGILVIEGAKESPVRSIEFKSKDWKLDVRVVFLPLK